MFVLSPQVVNLNVLLAVVSLLPMLSRAQVGTESSETAVSQAEITGVYFDVSQIHHDSASNGDTWDFAWADDGSIYSFNCDGRGYGKFAARNISFNRLVGDRWNELIGTAVDSMRYGGANERKPDLSNWKTTGAESIDGVLYAFVANNWYGNQDAYGGSEPEHNLRQTVMNMSLICSTDHGQTWTRDAAENYSHPMWSSKKFSTAFFVKYGQDGGRTSQDGQDKYVYAISNDGYWNCGSHFYLGRVLRPKIGRLQAADWDFYADGRWTKNVEDATPLTGFSNGHMKDAMGSPLWISKLHKYVTVTWFDPGTTEKWHYPENVTFAFYAADHPWGPWKWVGAKSASDFIADPNSRIHRWYGPSLSPKFVSENPDGSVTVILTFSGQTWEDTAQSLYKNNSLPVTFYTAPLPKVVRTFNDTDARFSGDWNYETNTSRGDYMNDVHSTTAPNAEAEFAFEGVGIEVLSEKSSEMGEGVEIVIDGRSKGSVSLYQDPMPLLYQVEIYRDMNLRPGRHIVEVINRSQNGERVLVDGFRVYKGIDFDSNSRYSILNRETGESLIFRDGSLTTVTPKSGERVTEWQIVRKEDCAYDLSVWGQQQSLGNDAEDGRATVVSSAADPEKAHTHWIIRPVGNGTFSIMNRVTGLAISQALTGRSHSSIAQLEYMGRDAQKWQIRADDTPAQRSRTNHEFDPSEHTSLERVNNCENH